MPITLCGDLQLCPIVVPECHLSCLYASPRAGLRALIKLLKFITESHQFMLRTTHPEQALYCSIFRLYILIIQHFIAAVNTGLDKMSFWQ